MNNIILIYSPTQRTGKTHLTKELLSRKIVNKVDSFAVYIKKLSHDLHKGVSHLNLSKEDLFDLYKSTTALSSNKFIFL